MDLQDSVNRAIAEHLPSQVADVLRKRLEQAEKDRESLDGLQGLYDGVCKRLEEAEGKNTGLRDKLAQHADLTERRVAVEAAERDLKVARLEIELNAEKQSKATVIDLFKSLTRNVEFRNPSGTTIHLARPAHGLRRVWRTAHDAHTVRRIEHGRLAG